MLTFYYDVLSQPSRAVLQFLKTNNIVYKDRLVSLKKGEHRSAWFLKVNPVGRVPVIDDGGFVLTESVAILKYLAVRYVVPDHWYPADNRQRARVDEYMAWQHTNTRFNAVQFWIQVEKSQTNAQSVDKAKLDKAVSDLNSTLDSLESMYLQDQLFLCGDSITIADLMAANELIQPLALGRDVISGRPKLQAWMGRVRERLHPHFDESASWIYKLRDKSEQKSKL